MILCVSGALTIYFLQSFVVEPINLHLHDSSDFVHRIEALMADRPGSLVFYKENPDGLPIKYLVNATRHFPPRFIDNLGDLNETSHPIWLLTRDKNVEELQITSGDKALFTYSAAFAGTPFTAIYFPSSP